MVALSGRSRGRCCALPVCPAAAVAAVGHRHSLLVPGAPVVASASAPVRPPSPFASGASICTQDWSPVVQPVVALAGSAS
uniref:Putative secreted protein n=1 Tax=Anopheles triannulatus TaxID=58253 RepID=A0A2M4B3S2_9DIPT